ncbi:alpha/beta hydrolase [Apibacter muscae]|uniref:alpha/beta fold hydrolase n=1 Tax=Apibacter muscae TaxID=2509004 RepID=UPI0011ADD684|nr:alpha/beta hydrolase [Apibacter muscae]TWP24756.1 alpha/beta hydrolase [Apibacter muscae]
MPLIKINNKNVNVLELNPEGKSTIVMIHGMFTNSSIFYFNIAPILAKKFRIIMYDLKSHGLSEKVDHGYDLKTLSKDFIDLLEEFKLEKVSIVGYSFGGLIALYIAIYYPEKIERIAIIDSPLTNRDEETDKVLEKYGNEFLELYMKNYSISTNIKPNHKQLEKNRRLYNFLLHETTLPKDLITDEHFTSKENMEKVKHETLLLYGNQSDCLPDGEFLNNSIPKSKFFIGNGDHNIPIQNHVWINEKLSTFFNI